MARTVWLNKQLLIMIAHRTAGGLVYLGRLSLPGNIESQATTTLESLCSKVQGLAMSFVKRPSAKAMGKRPERAVPQDGPSSSQGQPAQAFTAYSRYNLTKNPYELHHEFRRLKCERFFVECVGADTAGWTKNLVRFKVDVESPYNETEGMVLAMEPDPKSAAKTDTESEPPRDYHPAALFATPVNYKGKSAKSLRTFELNIREGLTFGELANALMRKNLHQFAYCIDGVRLHGCRDWM